MNRRPSLRALACLALSAWLPLAAGAQEPPPAAAAAQAPPVATTSAPASATTDEQIQALQAQAARAAARQRAAERDMQEAPARLRALREALATQPATQPAIPADLSLDQLQQMLSEAEATLTVAQQQQADLDAEPRRRAEQIAANARLVVEARQRLERARQDLADLDPEGMAPAALAARQALLEAQAQAAQAEIAAAEAESRSYEARAELLAARRDEARRRVQAAQRRAEALGDALNVARRREAEEAAAEARRQRLQAARAHPLIREAAERNAEVAEARVGPEGVPARIEHAQADTARLTRELAGITRAFESIRERERISGLTDRVGQLLRQQQAILPDPRLLERTLDERSQALVEVQLQLVELRDELAALDDPEQAAAERVAELDAGLAAEQREALRQELATLLRARREQLESLVSDLEAYQGQLDQLIAVQRETLSTVRAFAQYIDERALWIRSAPPLWVTDLAPAVEAVHWLLAPAHWLGLARSMALDIRTRWLLYALAGAALGGLILSRVRMERRLQAIGDQVLERDGAGVRATLWAILLTVLISVLGPALLAFFAWRLGAAPQATPFMRALSSGLFRTASLFWTLSLFWHVCRDRGLGGAHFRWPLKSLRAVRERIAGFMALGLPLVFVISSVGRTENPAWRNSLGRAAFITGLVALAVFFQRLLRPGGPVMQESAARMRGGWLWRTRYLWYGLSVLVPAALAVAALLGYSYTAGQLMARVLLTVWLVLALLVLNATLRRWIFLMRRRVALREAQKRVENRARQREAQEQAAAGEAPPVVVESEVDLAAINSQTRQFLRYVISALLAIGLWWIWADVLPALAALDRLTLWGAISLADVLLALLVFVLTVMAARNIPGILEITILQRLPVDAGVRYALVAVSRYTIAVVGTVATLGLVGIAWEQVQWLVAAMTVGLGFGLQEIFANFVSGLIILFERPMRVGDTVTVGDISGTVSRIRIRATTITDWNRKELIVPNKEFITSSLVNWTLSDTVLRLVIPVGIAYGSDTALAEKLLLEAAEEHPDVLETPKPAAFFIGFGASSLDFELRAFVPDFNVSFRIRHQILRAIDEKFRRASIEIAFPQSDLHLRSIDTPIPIRVETQDP